MVDFSLDSDLPISPSGSDFDALDTLNPPSPVLTPSQLTFALSSGDIPILLYDEGYADDDAELSDCSGSDPRSRYSTTLRRGSAVPVSSQENRTSCARHSISSIKSGSGVAESIPTSSTCISVGTFGPRRRRRTLRASLESAQSSASPSKSPSPSFSNHRKSGDFDNTGNCASSGDSPSKVFYHPIVYVDAYCDTSPQDKDSASEPANVTLISEVSSEEGLFEDMDTSPTATSVDPKKISWISSQSWDNLQYKDFVASHKTLQHPPAVQFISEYDGIDTDLSESHVHDRNMRTRQAEDCRRTQHQHQHHNPPIIPTLKHSRPVPVTRQNLKHDWLEEIYVEFLIDQEGFRAAHPCFRFSGTVRLRSPHHGHTPGVLMAQFKPIVRQTFHFHYAPFETSPILRRIAINDDDTHDYVSRQGLLSLKANGVYVLHGQELPVGSHHNHDFDAIKLHWQFEYMVDDRITDSSARIMTGEKTLTPLTFLCTPALLMPAQARKNNIMHVLKKGMVPKLHSEKLQPPGTPAPKGSEFSSLTSSLTDAYIALSSKTHNRSSHRRGKSHGSPKAKDSPLLRQNIGDGDRPLLNINHEESMRSEPELPARRRRNSSAGEHNDSPINLHFNKTGPSSHPKNHRRGTANMTQIAQQTIPLGRHIIPPKKLTELLEVDEKDNSGIHPTPDGHDRNINNYAPLTPRPRHTTAKIRDPARLL